MPDAWCGELRNRDGRYRAAAARVRHHHHHRHPATRPDRSPLPAGAGGRAGCRPPAWATPRTAAMCVRPKTHRSAARRPSSRCDASARVGGHESPAAGPSDRTPRGDPIDPQPRRDLARRDPVCRQRPDLRPLHRAARLLRPPIRIDHNADSDGRARTGHPSPQWRTFPFLDLAQDWARGVRTRRCCSVIGERQRDGACDVWLAAAAAQAGFLCQQSPDPYPVQPDVAAPSPGPWPLPPGSRLLAAPVIPAPRVSIRPGEELDQVG